MRCLVMIRVSTESQKLEDQHREMVDFCTGEGYDELVFVEDKGASAIKLNDSYRMMIQQVKDEIERDPGIRCFAVWELSRAFRNEGVFFEIKSFLLERGIQFLCKNPYLKLLNPDGTLNSGMEVAVTLMATLAKQEMELKKERFKRAKDSMRKQGRFTGGTVKFGYRVGEGGFLLENPETAPLVRLVFELYSTGRYSVRTLYEELKERGHQINYHALNRMVADSTYVDGRYHQLISQDLWDRCSGVRKRNFISVPKGKKHCFGSGILVCPVCGKKMVAEGVQYRCWGHNKYSAPPHCTNSLTTRVENLDGLLWLVASQEEVKFRYLLDKTRKEEMEKEVEVLKRKKETAQKRLESLDEKRSRIVESYIDGIISKEEREKRLKIATKEAKRYKDSILKFEEEIEGFLGAIRGSLDEVPNPDLIKSVFLGVIKESDIKIMDGIVKKQIRAATASAAAEFKGRKSAQLITIETVHSGTKRFYYVARKYKGHYFFTQDGKPLWSVRKIIREPLGKRDPRAFRKLDDW